jgi:predicted metalloprotease with PDZ domain
LTTAVAAGKTKESATRAVETTLTAVPDQEEAHMYRLTLAALLAVALPLTVARADEPTPADRGDDAAAGFRLGARVRLLPDRSGVEVLSVTPGGPADRLGLESGDRILAVNSRAFRTLGEYAALLDRSGGQARLTLLDSRTNRTVFTNVRLEPMSRR